MFCYRLRWPVAAVSKWINRAFVKHAKRRKWKSRRVINAITQNTAWPVKVNVFGARRASANSNSWLSVRLGWVSRWTVPLPQSWRCLPTRWLLISAVQATTLKSVTVCWQACSPAHCSFHPQMSLVTPRSVSLHYGNTTPLPTIIRW